MRGHHARIFGTGLAARRARRRRNARADLSSGRRRCSAPPRTRSSARSPSPSRGAGSDVSSLRTTAKRERDGWLLNGTKVFITNGGIADVHVVVATVDPSLGHRGQATFIVGPGTPGLKQGKKEKKLGIRASHTAEVVLEDCWVPGEKLLGGEEKLNAKLERREDGAAARESGALKTFEATRPCVGAQAVGIAGRRGSSRATTRRSADVRAADHRAPGRRVPARRHGDGDRGGAAARAGAPRGWAHRPAVQRTPRARCRS